MRSLGVLCLILLWLFPLGMRISLMMHYRLNKTYISQNLCENRNKPEMKCDGKCYLKKRLKKMDALEQGQNLAQTQDKFKQAPTPSKPELKIEWILALPVSPKMASLALAASASQTSTEPSFSLNTPYIERLQAQLALLQALEPPEYAA